MSDPLSKDNKPDNWDATTKWEQKLNDLVWSLDDGLPRFRHQVSKHPNRLLLPPLCSSRQYAVLADT